MSANPEPMKSHLNLSWFPKLKEASMKMTVSGMEQLAALSGSKSFYFPVEAGISVEKRGWRLDLSFIGGSQWYLRLYRNSGSSVNVTGGEMKIVSPSSPKEFSCSKGNKSGLVLVKSVKCPKGHVLQLSDRETGWLCDGRRDKGGCRKETESRPPTHRSNRYECQSCNFDLCDGCYEAKRQAVGALVCEFGDYINVIKEDFEIQCRVVYFEPTYEEDYVDFPLPAERKLLSDVCADYELLMLSGTDSDVTFVFGKTELPAHKAILRARCTYFERMFSSGMAESQSSQIQVEDADPESFKSMLKHIYCGRLPDEMDSSASKILPLAEKYDLPELKAACSYWMQKGLTTKTVCQALIDADLYRCANLKKKCLEFLKTEKGSMEEGALDVLEAHPKLLVESLRYC